MGKHHTTRVNPLFAGLTGQRTASAPLSAPSQSQSPLSSQPSEAQSSPTNSSIAVPAAGSAANAPLPALDLSAAQPSEPNRPVADHRDGAAPATAPLPSSPLQPLTDTALAAALQSVAARLLSTPAHSETPLVFTDDQRRELLTLLGTAEPESVIRHVRSLVSVDAGVGALTFSTEQLERTGFRCVGEEKLVDKLQEFCNYGINANVGLS